MLGYVKARGPRVCECCKANISTGSQIAMYGGRPWIPAHLIEYQAKRRALAASGR